MLAVAVPSYGPIVTQCELALRELEKRGHHVRREFGCSAVDVIRNVMTADLLKDGYDEIMWIDADIGFNPDDVQRLRDLNVPISCGLYTKKGPREFACNMPQGTVNIVFGENGTGPIDIQYVGFGFVHVRKAALTIMAEANLLPLCNKSFGKPYYPYFAPMVIPVNDGAWYLAEDFAFCERAKRAGVKIVADPRIRLYHYGSYGYSWEDLGGPVQRFASYNLTFTAESKTSSGS